MAHPQVAIPGQLPAGSQATSPASMLVVDDSATIGYAISCLIEHLGIARVVGRAQTVAQALQAITRQAPEFVLLDAEMPELKAERAIFAVREFSQHTKVIVLATSASPLFRNGCMNSGAFAFVEKGKCLSQLKDLTMGFAGRLTHGH
jgi:CheY-like chemotaxis protein